jgi:archaellum component FlaG (FlaF/FlaG flagellin family)
VNFQSFKQNSFFQIDCPCHERHLAVRTTSWLEDTVVGEKGRTDEVMAQFAIYDLESDHCMNLCRFSFFSLLLLNSGCAGVTIGPAAMPSGDGILVNKNGNAEFQLSDRTVTVLIGGYEPDVVFIGPVVPLIPIPNLNGGGKLFVCLLISTKDLPIRFDPRSIKVIEDGKEHQPNSVLQAPNCQIHMSSGGIDPGDGPVVVEKQVTFTARFDDLKPPRHQFTLMADGLTPVYYSIKRETGAGFLGQR